MKWSWNIGRIAGIRIRIHLTFLLVLAWGGYEQWTESHSARGVALGIAFLVVLFGCVLLHELGHAVMAKRFGIRTRDITLLPIGGVARLERMPSKPREELLVALAGPAVNVVIAGVLFLILLGIGQPELSDELPLTGAGFAATLMAINVVLIAFNLLPAFPMDGGRVLRAVLAMRMSYARATRLAARLGQAMAIGFVLAGTFGIGPLQPNPFLMMIGFFVWLGARQEAKMAEAKSALSGVPVAEAMMTNFQTLRAEDDLHRAAELIVAGAQQDFPVLSNNEVVGVLTRKKLLEELQKKGIETSVGEAMQRDVKVVQASELLEPLIGHLQNSECRTLPVVEFGRLVGLLTWENLREYLAIRTAAEAAERLG